MKVTIKRGSNTKNLIDFDTLQIGEAFMVEGAGDKARLRVKISSTNYVMLLDFVHSQYVYQYVYNYRSVYGSDKVVPYHIETVTLKGLKR